VSKVEEVVIYICQHYPHKDELSNARLTKMVYLADWRSALMYDRQLTGIGWIYNHYGPYKDDVMTAARANPCVTVREDRNQHGDRKQVIAVTANTHVPRLSLTQQECEVLDWVIQKTQKLSWTEFIRLVYSTYPIVTRPRFATLDLVELAGEYREARSRTVGTIKPVAPVV
jgi:hypothetical protein